MIYLCIFILVNFKKNVFSFTVYIVSVYLFCHIFWLRFVFRLFFLLYLNIYFNIYFRTWLKNKNLKMIIMANKYRAGNVNTV